MISSASLEGGEFSIFRGIQIQTIALPLGRASGLVWWADYVVSCNISHNASILWFVHPFTNTTSSCDGSTCWRLHDWKCWSAVWDLALESHSAVYSNASLAMSSPAKAKRAISRKFPARAALCYCKHAWKANSRELGSSSGCTVLVVSVISSFSVLVPFFS